ncbi:MAG: MFS transporter [Alphaproteobacteria bacterium]
MTDDAATPTAAAPPARGLGWYMAGQGTWFAGLGIQLVLFAWLVTVVLDQPADRVGLAQMAMMLPSLAFMLIGGGVADRGDLRRLLLRYHLVAAVPPLVLAWLVGTDRLTYALLIGYGVAMGTLGAFVIPARDALLHRVAEGTIQRGVMLATMGQFIGQLVGMVIAGFAALVGAPALMVLHAVLILTGAAALFRLAPAPPLNVNNVTGWRAIRDGVTVAFGDAALRPAVLSVFAVGFCFVGSYLVVLPLTVRDSFAGGATELAIVNVAFWAGTILTTVALLRRGGVARPGRAMLAAMAGGVGVLAAMALPLNFVGFAALCFVWGIGGGVVMTMGRTIMQTEAPADYRARVMALYQLALMGAAPVGALLMGLIVAAVGVRLAPLAPAALMALIVAVLVLATPMWRYRLAHS